MIKDLQNIFDSITPDNIKDLPVIQSAMEIFIETLENLSKESIDIKKVYDNPVIREELIKIYLDDLYSVLQSLRFNQKIIEKINYTNDLYGTEYFKTDVIYNIADYINDEHFITFKAFKEKKGTETAIRYIYDLLSVFINSGDTVMPLQINPISPFNLEIKGTLPVVFYQYIIKPMAHPLGFTYTYAQIVQLLLEDYFPAESFTYVVKKLEVRCLKTDGSTYTTDYKYDEGVLRVVTGVETVLIGDTRQKKVFFDDGTYLMQVTTSTGQAHVYYMSTNSVDRTTDPLDYYIYNYDSGETYDLNDYDVILISYEDQCSIYFSYNFTFNNSIIDEISFEEKRDNRDFWSRFDLINKGSIYIGQEIQENSHEKSYIKEAEGIAFIDNTPESPTYLYPDEIGEFYIGEPQYTIDLGFNIYKDKNGNILTGTDIGYENGRFEFFWGPDYSEDLKMLLGKYELNYPVYFGGELVGIQDVKFTEVVNVANKVLERTVSTATFIKQNIGNEHYAAREHFISVDKFYPSNKETLIEPIYSASGAFQDYNGTNRGPVLNYIMYINQDDRYIGESPLTGNEYLIGDYYFYDLDNGNEILENPNLHIQYLETIVNGDAVNLQYMTYGTIAYHTYLDGIRIEDILFTPGGEPVTTTTGEFIYCRQII